VNIPKKIWQIRQERNFYKAFRIPQFMGFSHRFRDIFI
jgi:hypothetical protein